MAEFYAQPYQDATGFYFSTFDDFEKGMELLEERGIEEVEIQLIEGSTVESRLFDAAEITRGNIETWFDEVENLDEEQQVGLLWLVSYAGYKLDDALLKVEDVRLFEGSAEEYAEELLDEGVISEEQLKQYFDAEKFARDLDFGGDIAEINVDGRNFVITDPNL